MCTGHKYRLEEKGQYERTKDGKLTLKAKIIIGKEEFYNELKKEPLYWQKYNITKIPCGTCMECRLKDSKEWAFRCMKEAQSNEKNVMLTLTYDDKHIPRGIKPIKVDEITGEVLEYKMSNTLWKKEHQDFMKRLRKKYGTGIKFRLCGEYGSEKEYKDWKGNVRKATKRPHFHIICFGLDVPDMKFHKWSYCEWDKKQKNALFKSKTIDKLWGKGWVDLNEVNWETCAYVSRYIMKKQKGKGSKEHYEDEGLLPEYAQSSNRPGIGNHYFYENIEKFLRDEKHFIKTKKGILEIGAIRYYDKLIEKEYPEEWERIKRERRKRSESIMKEILAKTDIEESRYIDNKGRKTEKRCKKLIRPLA